MALEIVAQYKAGDTFRCAKRLIVDAETGALGEPCGTEIRMHGYWWCGQVCPNPKCLTTYHTGYGADNGLRDSRGFYPEDAKRNIIANIGRNDGQYIPEFK